MAKTTLSDTLFPVTEVPAVGVPTTIDSKEIDSTGYKFIVKEDGTILSCMTDDYRLITNQSLMNIASPIL